MVRGLLDRKESTDLDVVLREGVGVGVEGVDAHSAGSELGSEVDAETVTG